MKCLPLCWLGFVVLWASPCWPEEPASFPFTLEQVACEQAQIQRLGRRMVNEGLAGGNLVLWRSAGGGVYRGLLVAADFEGSPPRLKKQETQLAFDLILRPAGDRLGPGRPLLPQALLVRRDAASNLYQPTDPFPLDVHLDVAPLVPNAFARTMSLDLTNRPGEDRSERAGRGIATDDLASACHEPVSDFDQLILTVLSRTLRASVRLYPPDYSSVSDSSVKITLLRAPEPRHYWAHFYAYGEQCDDDDETGESCRYENQPLVLLEFAFETDDAGRLTMGTVRFLPECAEGQTSGCSVTTCPQLGIFITPPLTPGLDRQDQSAFDRGAFLRCDFGDPADTLTSATIDWADLLRDTAWNSPP